MTLSHLTAEELAAFMFNAIAHGDEQHRKWLRDKCEELAPQIASRLRGKPGWVMVPREDLIVATTLLMGLANPPAATDRFLNALYPTASQRSAAAGEDK